MHGRVRGRRGWALFVALAIAAFVWWVEEGRFLRPPESSTIEQLFAGRTSDRWVEVEGEVSRVLADDQEGSRHQRWILRLASGHTVLVAHNIDLAPRVPLGVGDRIELRGEYAWNDRGGVVHWTHHDPDGRHSGGWIQHEGRSYR